MHMSDGGVQFLHPDSGSHLALAMQTKEHGFQAKAAAEFAKLYKFQADLEEETGNACFVGLSAVATAQQCIRLGNHRAAARVQSEFRISDRRFWWLKVCSSDNLFPCCCAIAIACAVLRGHCQDCLWEAEHAWMGVTREFSA